MRNCNHVLAYRLIQESNINFIIVTFNVILSSKINIQVSYKIPKYSRYAY